MSSIRDIAKDCGLSIATVSRYINKSGYVSKEAEQKISQSIRKLNYIPNRNARAVFGNKSGTIGLIVPSLVNPFFSQMATIIGKLIQKDGNGCVICFTEDEIDKERESIDILLGYRVDGIIISRARNIEHFKNINIPIVSFESSIADNITMVSADNVQGGRIAFNHLYKKQCKRFVLVGGPETFQATKDRSDGFIYEAKEYGVEVEKILFDSDYHLSEIIQGQIDNFEFKAGDGIFVFNDITALFVMEKVIKSGFDVPNDVKIVGFDNMFISELSQPSLTTIEQPVDKIAEECYKALKIEIIKPNDTEARQIKLPVKLIERMTT